MAAGEKLRRARERLKLTYRDVAEASQEIAARRGNPDFALPLSRLADIETGGCLPSLFRLYTLCAVYHLDMHEVMRWYGVPVHLLAGEALQVPLGETHTLEVTPNGHAAVPITAETGIDLDQTTFLSRLIREWGKVPLSFLHGFDYRRYRYGLVGLKDSSMFPILRPGSLVVIDENRRRPARGGWTSEFDRPIYFLEHRHGFLCGWCALQNNRLLVQFHPSSEKSPAEFQYPGGIDVVGQVIGAAMLLDGKRRDQIRPSTVPTALPDPPDTTAVPAPAPKAV
ncbi:MAG: helix-turn-helix transcriptional regulator [Acidobacteriia bacterium]|nr:helix-turn-helix transcriptional regulator [Terriglobia bacterium]